MTTMLEAVPMTKKKRSDWRTSPRDEFVVGGERVSFLSYLVSEYPKGKDWRPCSSVGVLWKTTRSPRDKRGHLSGRPELTTQFLNWLSGEDIEGIAPADVPAGFSFDEVRAAIRRVKLRNPEAVLVLEWRQDLGPCVGLTPPQMLERLSLASHKSLTERLYTAVRLIVNEIDRGRGGLLDV